MNIPSDRVITVPFLREFLGLPEVRLDGVRDLLVVPRPGSTSLTGPWRLALGNWPEQWRDRPETAPGYLVVLHGTATPYFVAAIWDIDRTRWGSDSTANPQAREVPIAALPHEATSRLGGCRLDMETEFGWPLPEEQYAFL